MSLDLGWWDGALMAKNGRDNWIPQARYLELLQDVLVCFGTFVFPHKHIPSYPPEIVWILPLQDGASEMGVAWALPVVIWGTLPLCGRGKQIRWRHWIFVPTGLRLDFALNDLKEALRFCSDRMLLNMFKPVLIKVIYTSKSSLSYSY